MTLRVDEIEPGIVAYLDTSVLLNDSRLYRYDGDAHFRSGPFLCVAVGPGKTAWLELTRQSGRWGHYFAIKPEWRTGGRANWRRAPQYLNNVGLPFIGRDVVFADASHVEYPCWETPRCRVTAEGITAICTEMAARNALTF